MASVAQMIAEGLGGSSGAPPSDAPAKAPPEEAGDPVRDAMQDMIDAIGAGDADAAANAFRVAFKALELEPHMEAGEESETT